VHNQYSTIIIRCLPLSILLAPIRWDDPEVVRQIVEQVLSRIPLLTKIEIFSILAHRF
jgi:hypothetical protein